MATAAIREDLLSVTPDLKTMAKRVNEIIECRRSEAIRKGIAGKVRFVVGRNDSGCICAEGITFRDDISLSDGSTGTCEVVQHGQTVFRAGYDKYNKEIEQIEMYIPGSWEAVLDELATESLHMRNDAAEKALHITASSWHINIYELRTGGSE
ncbi:MAG: hypothetical protein ACYC0V_01685 [Armatimonadota bacterium]